MQMIFVQDKTTEVLIFTSRYAQEVQLLTSFNVVKCISFLISIFDYYVLICDFSIRIFEEQSKIFFDYGSTMRFEFSHDSNFFVSGCETFLQKYLVFMLRSSDTGFCLICVKG